MKRTHRIRLDCTERPVWEPFGHAEIICLAVVAVIALTWFYGICVRIAGLVSP